jgi:cyclase
MRGNLGIAALGLVFSLGVVGLSSHLPNAVAAEADPGEVFHVAGNIHLAVVEGRNTPFLVGDDTVLLAETNFARNAQTVAGLIATVTPNPVGLAVNSHWHPDHVGGNAYFAENGALTLSHENTRARLIARQQNQATGPQAAEIIDARHLPALTIKSDMTVHWGDEVVELIHYADAHTDSDVVMYYRNSNVVFIGGLLNYPMYAGVFGVEGFLHSLDEVLAETDEDTVIIPWRGPVVGSAEVQEWRNLFAEVADKITTLMANGNNLEEILAARPTLEFDAKWGNQRSPEQFVEDIHAALSGASE